MKTKTPNIYVKAAAVLLCSASLLLSFSACNKTDCTEFNNTKREIGFSASVGRVDAVSEETKASLTDTKPSGTIMLTSADGSISIPMAVFETEGIDTPMTKSSLINGPLDPGMPGDDAPIPLKDSLNSFMASAYSIDSQVSIFTPELSEVSWNGSDWSMADVYYWPQATGLDIYAYTNMPAGEYAGLVIDKESRSQTLTYVVPRDTDDQKDILMAMYSGTGDNTGKAELMFYHPLTAVQFSRDASMTESSGITEIIMNGVNYGGSVTQQQQSLATFNWTVSNEQTTVSQDNDGKPFELHGSIDGDPFLLVPQRVSGLRSVVLTVTLIYNGHEIPLNAIIDNASWNAGKTYTYVIGYKGSLEVSLDLQETSSTQKGAAVISNVGVKKCYVRAIVDGFVTDKDGYIKRTYLGNEGIGEGVGAFTAAEGTFGTDIWNDNWVMGDDGFYYYTIPLEVDDTGHTNPAAKTTPLFNSYVFNGLSAYEYYEMNISTQAIEWDSDKNYVTANWGANAANLLQ